MTNKPDAETVERMPDINDIARVICETLFGPWEGADLERNSHTPEGQSWLAAKAVIALFPTPPDVTTDRHYTATLSASEMIVAHRKYEPVVVDMEKLTVTPLSKYMNRDTPEAGAKGADSLSVTDGDVSAHLRAAIAYIEITEGNVLAVKARTDSNSPCITFDLVAARAALQAAAPVERDRVTDEMVEAARDAYDDAFEAEYFADGTRRHNGSHAMRAALEAALKSSQETGK